MSSSRLTEGNLQWTNLFVKTYSMVYFYPRNAPLLLPLASIHSPVVNGVYPVLL
jgi:hypothetical protein